jgi:hypothetical protein
MSTRLRLLGIGIVACAIAILVAPERASQAQEAKTFPKVVMLIRHAEKPADDTSPDLSAEGKKRAEALPELFRKSDTRPEPLPTPDFIFATKNSKNSHRPLETITPLAKQLKLTVNSDFADDDVEDLAQELFKNQMYLGKTVLVCWHHGKLPKLARKLKAPDAPEEWDGKVFDRVWRIDYDDKGKATFSTLPQQLLPGDSKK